MKHAPIFSFFVAVLLLPTFVHAEELSLSAVAPAGAVAAGDTVLLPVMLNTSDSVSINSLQARVVVSGAGHLMGVSTGGSVFSLWPEEPTVINDAISFVGGTPGSVYGAPLRVVTLIIALGRTGVVTVHISGATAYAGDGKGTQVALKDSMTTFSVGAKAGLVRDELSELVSKDTMPPDAFPVELGRDTSFEGGAYFVSFATRDAGSGVARYEVQEGDGPWRVAEANTYVLRDQSLSSPVSVRAIDVAGNVRVERVSFKSNRTALFMWGGGVVLVAGIIIFWIRRRRRQ